jgi:hypothetical protein
MSFRTAYNDFKRNNTSYNRGFIRDMTSRKEKRMMDEYYKRMSNWTPSNGRK